MMHVRGCHCDDCLPGHPAQPTRVYDVRKEQKRLKNKRYYLRKKLGFKWTKRRGWDRDVDEAALEAFSP